MTERKYRANRMKKESTKTWLNILLALAVLNFVIGFYCGRAREPKLEPFKVPSIIDIQRIVGAKPDGIVGLETIELWEIAYANQEAAKFMTESGAPRSN